MERVNKTDLNDLDQTLDRLLENAVVIEKINSDKELESECELLIRTQESLYSHFAFLQENMPKNTPKRQAEQIKLKSKKLERLEKKILTSDTLALTPKPMKLRNKRISKHSKK